MFTTYCCLYFRHCRIWIVVSIQYVPLTVECFAVFVLNFVDLHHKRTNSTEPRWFPPLWAFPDFWPTVWPTPKFPPRPLWPVCFGHFVGRTKCSSDSRRRFAEFPEVPQFSQGRQVFESLPTPFKFNWNLVKFLIALINYHMLESTHFSPRSILIRIVVISEMLKVSGGVLFDQIILVIEKLYHLWQCWISPLN